MASCDPMESPSGLACEERTKRRRSRMASTMRASSGLDALGLSVVVAIVLHGRRRGRGIQLVQQLLDAILSRDRFVVQEGQVRHPFEPKARSDLPPEEGHGSLERPRGV